MGNRKRRKKEALDAKEFHDSDHPTHATVAGGIAVANIKASGLASRPTRRRLEREQAYVETLHVKLDRQRGAIDRLLTIIRQAEDKCTCGAVKLELKDGTEIIETEVSERDIRTRTGSVPG